jgi:hypothetical protein
MVSEIRVPSSSSSKSYEMQSVKKFLIIHSGLRGHLPTVVGRIFTPSSMCATSASSESLCSITCFPQRVFTKVVRPNGHLVSLMHGSYEAQQRRTGS